MIYGSGFGKIFCHFNRAPLKAECNTKSMFLKGSRSDFTFISFPRVFSMQTQNSPVLIAWNYHRTHIDLVRISIYQQNSDAFFIIRKFMHNLVNKHYYFVGKTIPNMSQHGSDHSMDIRQFRNRDISHKRKKLKKRNRHSRKLSRSGPN